jgi:hypothetical protein
MQAIPKALALLAVVTWLVASGLPQSSADSPRFPDLGSYTPVNVGDYTVELPNPGRAPIEDVVFMTPGGVPCGFLPGAGGTQGTVGCTSDRFPGVNTEGPYTYIDTALGVQNAGSTPYSDGSIQDHKISVLPPFHSIAFAGMICGVDDKDTTACKDSQRRGFVLSPAWSGWLPKA